MTEHAYLFATFETWTARVVQCRRRYDGALAFYDAEGWPVPPPVATRPAMPDEIAAYDKRRDHVDAVREMDRRDRRMGRRCP